MKKVVLLFGAVLLTLSACGGRTVYVNTRTYPPSFYMEKHATNGNALELSVGQRVEAFELVGLAGAELRTYKGQLICDYNINQLVAMTTVNELNPTLNNNVGSIPVSNSGKRYTSQREELQITSDLPIDDNAIITAPGEYYVQYDLYNVCSSLLGGMKVKDKGNGHKYVSTLGISERVKVIVTGQVAPELVGINLAQTSHEPISGPVQEAAVCAAVSATGNYTQNGQTFSKPVEGECTSITYSEAADLYPGVYPFEVVYEYQEGGKKFTESITVRLEVIFNARNNVPNSDSN